MNKSIKATRGARLILTAFSIEDEIDNLSYWLGDARMKEKAPAGDLRKLQKIIVGLNKELISLKQITGLDGSEAIQEGEDLNDFAERLGKKNG